MPIEIQSFLTIVQAVAPYSLVWALGYKTYKIIINAITGKDLNI